MKTIRLLLIFLICASSVEAHLFFSYSPQELQILDSEHSNKMMTKDELKKWDEISKSIALSEDINFYDRTRLFMYLYVAQNDAAMLSKKISGDFKGSLEPLSRKVLELFVKTSLPNVSSDKYSDKLAQIVFSKVQQRVKEENAQTNEFTVLESNKKEFTAGLVVAKWIPWFAKPSTDFWAPPPPKPDDPVWKEEVRKIKEAQTPMTEEKKKIVNRWAGIPEKWSDEWRVIANRYLFSQKDISFEKVIQVRAALMVTLYDGIAAYVTMKYHYQTIRPKIYDSSVTYMIEVPKHPAYPAGHAAEGAMGSTVLSYYFPNEAPFWHQLAKEESLARVQAAVHYPVDVEAGEIIGKKVADRVLQAIN